MSSRRNEQDTTNGSVAAATVYRPNKLNSLSNILEYEAARVRK
jgi:hypothetical protein